MNNPTPVSAAEAGSTQPFVSVIVPVYNGADTIGCLLDALAAQTYPADRCEFIVADDASTDRTVEIVQARGGRFKVVRCPSNQGSYTARNGGLAQACGQLIAFTDADCRPAPDWIERGVELWQREGAPLIAGAVVIRPEVPGSAIQCYDAFFGIQQAFFAKKLNFGATANLFVERAVVDRIGGFDASLRSGGDRKFCRDAAALGERLVYGPESVVYHPPRTSYRDLAIKQIRISKGHVRIFKPWARLYILPLHARDPESFDRSRFSAGGLAFKLRFKAVYYSLEMLHVWVYGWGCLMRHALKRP